MDKGALIAVICIAVVLVIALTWWFLDYLRKEREKDVENAPSAPTKDESFIRVVCVFGILCIVAIIAFAVSRLIKISEEPTQPITTVPTVEPTVALNPTISLSPTVTLMPTVEPIVTKEVTLEPTVTQAPTITLEATATPISTATPKLTATEQPTPTSTVTPVPTATFEPTATPDPTATPAPMVTSEPTSTPKPTATLEPTATPKPTSEPTSVPTATPVPTKVPTATPIPTKAPVGDYELPKNERLEESLEVPLDTYTRDDMPSGFTDEQDLSEYMAERHYRLEIEPIMTAHGYTLKEGPEIVKTVERENWTYYHVRYIFSKGKTEFHLTITVSGMDYLFALDAQEMPRYNRIEIYANGKLGYEYSVSQYKWPDEGLTYFLE